ncbi:MAG: hypothetical protein ACYSWW_17920, partial [Planctomycetota bacterium]
RHLEDAEHCGQTVHFDLFVHHGQNAADQPGLLHSHFWEYLGRYPPIWNADIIEKKVEKYVVTTIDFLGTEWYNLSSSGQGGLSETRDRHP